MGRKRPKRASNFVVNSEEMASDGQIKDAMEAGFAGLCSDMDKLSVTQEISAEINALRSNIQKLAKKVEHRN